MNDAAKNGYLYLVEFLHNNREEGCTMDKAARNGHLNVVEFLHNNREEGCTKRAMTFAAILMDIWTEEGCTAMDKAARNGHLNSNVVEFLHNNREEGCTEEAMNLAIEFQNWEVASFLHCNRTEDKIHKCKCGLWAFGSCDNKFVSNEFKEDDLKFIMLDTIHQCKCGLWAFEVEKH
eukprot:Pgem_evm1s2632